MEAPEKIVKLVETFTNNVGVYKSSNYNETQVRQEFINPFFKALGWDIDNEQGFAEAYKDVIHEDAIKIGGSTKAPDYSFRIGSQRKFFLEAKKPSVSIKEDIHPAYQLRRYAWSAKLPLSILTDFEELAVYDCTTKPNPSDKASIGRITYYTFKDYLEKWDEINSIYSKDAVLKGSFDKFAISNKGKKGTSSVDTEFLKSLDGWRDLLARNIVNRNYSIGEDELNYSLQKIIDRIIFLRICEDRGVELEGQLQNAIGANIYTRLKEIFHSADQKYNSGLFDYKKDKITDNLSIDDKTLKTIIEEMYYPKSPYEFSVIPVEILGHSYEQYLGKVIRITPGHRIKIEEKPEVRKAGGVYYTPQYIVDYIVKNTVGKLLEKDIGDGVLGIGREGIGDGVLGIGREGIGDGVLGLGNNGIDNKFGDENADLQRIESLARSNEFSSDDLSNDSRVSHDGEIRTDKSDTESGCIGSDKYSGGVRKGLEEGIHLSSIGSKGLTDGIRDTSDNSSEIGLSEGKNIQRNLGTNSNNRQTISRSAKISKTNTLNPIPNPPNPIPNPLTPEQASKLRILDPACGSGSFLLGAYQFLLDWHLVEYSKNPDKFAKGKEPKIFKVADNEYRLTTTEKKKILLNNIYGVDIDSQAVEVTKLSLMLKVLEGETEESINRNLSMFRERALPDLSNNIKCGNSLIGSDFYEGKEVSMFDEEEMYKINAFDWDKEFPEVFSAGGFDAVIGNPPYVDFRVLEYTHLNYLKEKYDSTKVKEKWNLYIPFIELGQIILKSSGLFGFIIPNAFLVSNFGLELRKIILNKTQLYKLIDVSKLKVFGSVATYPILLFYKNIMDINSKIKLKYPTNLTEFYNNQYQYITQNKLNDEKKDFIISTSLTTTKMSFLDRIETNTKKLENFCRNFIWGTSITGFKNYKIQKHDFLALDKNGKSIYHKVIQTADIKRYFIDWQEEYINKNIYSEKVQNEFLKEKIVIARLTKHLQATIDTETFYLGKSSLLTDISINKYFLLALLNSKLLSYIFYTKFENTHMSGGYLRFDIPYLKQLPVVNIDFTNPKEKAQHDQMVSLVDRMLDLNKKVRAEGISTQEKKILEKQIELTDKQIDKLVYELYGLTEEEISIIENG